MWQCLKGKGIMTIQQVVTCMKGKLSIVLVLAALLTGCTPNDFIRRSMDRMAPTEDVELAHKSFSAIRSGDFATMIELLDPQFITEETESDLMEMAALFDQGELLSTELVGCNVHSSRDGRRSHLSYQYEFTDGWVLASIMIDTEGDERSVFGINVHPLPAALGEINAFTLENRGARHYIMLALAVAIPIFIFWTVYLCARSKIEKKALWIFFILLGIMRIQLNWTTGQMGFQPIGFQIPGAGISKMGLYAPWILTVSVPLGAIWFQLKRRKLLSADAHPHSDSQAGSDHRFL